jgi:16S rRNA (guanine527-N7)-methyltransferase
VLRKWQPKLNLVANGTLGFSSGRGISWIPSSFSMLAPETGDLWLDLGSGGGFPGLVLRHLRKGLRVRTSFELVESDTRKCAFLREVARQTGVGHHPQHPDRSTSSRQADIVSARALAPLAAAARWVHRHMATGWQSVYCKRGPTTPWSLKPRAPTGRWMSTSCRPMTAADSVILRIRNLSHA